MVLDAEKQGETSGPIKRSSITKGLSDFANCSCSQGTNPNKMCKAIPVSKLSVSCGSSDGGRATAPKPQPDVLDDDRREPSTSLSTSLSTSCEEVVATGGVKFVKQEREPKRVVGDMLRKVGGVASNIYSRYKSTSRVLKWQAETMEILASPAARFTANQWDTYGAPLVITLDEKIDRTLKNLVEPSALITNPDQQRDTSNAANGRRHQSQSIWFEQQDDIRNVEHGNDKRASYIDHTDSTISSFFWHRLKNRYIPSLPCCFPSSNRVD